MTEQEETALLSRARQHLDEAARDTSGDYLYVSDDLISDLVSLVSALRAELAEKSKDAQRLREAMTNAAVSIYANNYLAWTTLDAALAAAERKT